jgi:ribulose-phosphate 3-epimerase
MVTNPEKHIENFLNDGSDLITWHAELDINHQNLIELVKSKSKLSGLAINPSTPISSIDSNILTQVDSVLVMSVVPGKSGQTLILDCLDKIKEIKAINPKCKVYVDGGVNGDNARLVYQKGADAIVSGSYLFKDIKENSKKLIKKI